MIDDTPGEYIVFKNVIQACIIEGNNPNNVFTPQKLHYIDEEGSLQNNDRPGCANIPFPFTDGIIDPSFLVTLTNNLQNNDTIIIDLALSEKEREDVGVLQKTDNPATDYANIIIYAPQIIEALLAHYEAMNLKIIVISNITVADSEDILKYFLPNNIQNNHLIKYMLTGELRTIDEARASREQFISYIS